MYNMCAGDSQEEQLHAKRTMSERQKKKTVGRRQHYEGKKFKNQMLMS